MSSISRGVIKSRFIVSFFLRELLSRPVPGGIALFGWYAGRPRAEFLTERYLEHAVPPSLHASESALFGFQRARRHMSSHLQTVLLTTIEKFSDYLDKPSLPAYDPRRQRYFER